ncbi:unnamed protein product [Alopecurus aequalis]
MAGEGTSSRSDAMEDPSALLQRLHLEENERDDMIWEEEVDDPAQGPKWLAIALVLTGKSFGQGALIADMRAAWNPAQQVTWRRINPNLFTIQFQCLADWNTALHQGPWEFRGFGALIIAEYDGFSNPESVKLNKLETWSQIYKLPDAVLKNEVFVKNMAKRIGEIKEVQITLPSGYVGEFIRVRVSLDVDQKLTRFVSFTRGGETEFFQVKYEKLPTFCRACGKLGHWHQECGSGEFDEAKLEWGPFILAPRRGRGGGRGPGQRDAGREGPFTAYDRGGRDGFGRGRGTTDDPRDRNTCDSNGNIFQATSWRWNSIQNNQRPNNAYAPNPNLLVNPQEKPSDVDMTDNGIGAKKRLAFDKAPDEADNLALVVTEKSPIDLQLNQLEERDSDIPSVDGTPQKNHNKKKLKANSGAAVDLKDIGKKYYHGVQ